MSHLDLIVRKIILTKFFTKGWGHPDNLKRIFTFRKIISNRSQCQNLVACDYPVYIEKDEDSLKDCRIIKGKFKSPFVEHLPGIMPTEVETANFEMVLPHKWKGLLKPMCIHLAGTGDHGFGRRRKYLAQPLAKEYGIGSILLENPFYGMRKPKEQFRSSLHNVSDLFVMGAALILESLVLLHWCKAQGYGPLGLTGISMGGHMASLAATNWHEPVSLIPILSWSTASSVFTQGVMSTALPWELLIKQYMENQNYASEVAELIVSPERLEDKKRELFNLGSSFSRDFEQYDHMRTLGEKHAASYLKTNTDREGKTVSEYYFSEIMKKFLNLTDSKNSNEDSIEQIKSEAVHFMQGVMDECTHLGNFSVPVDPSLVIIVAANNDAYIPRGTTLNLHELWPGSELREIDRGHITAFLFEKAAFRKAIADSFEKQTKKYYSHLTNEACMHS